MASSIRLVVGLAWRNLCRRPWQAALLLLALCLATTTVSMAMTVSQTGNSSWEQLWHQTNGLHVRAGVGYHEGVIPTDLASTPDLTEADRVRIREPLDALAGTPGVVASEIVSDLYTTGEIGGAGLELLAIIREPGRPAAVDQPLVTSGAWLNEGNGVVLEDGLAATLAVRPGDMITVAGQHLPVRGAARSVAVDRYPLHQPARIWVNPATADALRAAGASDFSATLELRLANPHDAAAFVAAHLAQAELDHIGLDTWQSIRDSSNDELIILAIALLAIGSLLAGLSAATAAVLVAGRMAAQTRQLGTLKAVGVTPAQGTWMMLVEHLALAGLAVAIGVTAGGLLAPLVAGSAPSLYGSPQAVPVSWPQISVAAAIAVGIVLLATIRPTLRGIRHSTLRSLSAGAHQPRRSSRLAGWAEQRGLPTPAVLGLRFALRRPGRTVANAAGLALAVAMVVAGLALNSSIQHFLAGRPAPADATERALIDQLLTVVYAAAALLMVLAVINAIVVAIFAARDNSRSHAILRAVGATPRQTVGVFVISQLGACLLACAAGIPLGALLFNAMAGSDLSPSRLPAIAYPAIAVAVVVLYALIVAVPARVLARQAITPLLTYE